MNNFIMNNKNIDEDTDYALTAIVLVYNGEPYLDMCLNSLVNQTLNNLEIILINDASTDDSLLTCKKYEKMHDNVRLINQKENCGLGANANLGISLAKGEYVILVDNDDIIPKDAYKILYDKAKETDADICMGKANFVRGNSQFDFDYREGYVWRKEQVINDINEFPEIFEDVYYWNQVVKRDLLLYNNVKLPTGTVYADRYFTHKTYTFAEKIVIIPDCVYLWRQVPSSLSHGRFEPDNFTDRLDSYELDLDYFINQCADYFKILLRRFMIPIKGVLTNDEFGNIVFNRMRMLIHNQEENFDDLYDNDLTLIENLYAFLVSNNYEYELIQLLQLDLVHQLDVHNENGKSYWNLPLFRNPNIDIPDKFFEIKQLMNQFVTIDELIVTDNKIKFSNIRIPKYVSVKKLQIVFMGVTRYDQILDDNSLTFDLNLIEENNSSSYNIEISPSDLPNFEVFDIYLKAVYENEKYNKLRINNISLKKINSKSRKHFPIITKSNNLSFIVQNMDKKFKLMYDKNKLKIYLSNHESFKKDLKILIRKDMTNELTYFSFNKDMFELEWKYFLDSHSTYSLFLTVFNNEGKLRKNIRFKDIYLDEFDESLFETDENLKVEIYKNKYGNIMLYSF